MAACFGCLRNIGSGTCGRPDLLSASDSTHPRLFLEAKHPAQPRPEPADEVTP